MKRPRRLRLKIALALLLLAVAAFPYGWGPAIAGCVARSYLDLEEPGSSELRVECVTPFRLRASGLRPGAPSCERVEVRYSPGSLLSGRIRSARLTGLSVDAASLLPHGEDGAGPFADDVRLNLAKAGLGAEAANVMMIHRMGGQVVTVDDAVKAGKMILGK